MIRHCRLDERAAILAAVNDGATAYRGVIPASCWHEPYMASTELDRELAAGVAFSGYFDGDDLLGVMGLQRVLDVMLVRHAYTQTAHQGRGIGSALLAHVWGQTDRATLIGTWKAATWAVRFYEGRGFRLIDGPLKDELLQRYWTVPASQMDASVVLADSRWAPPGRGGG